MLKTHLYRLIHDAPRIVEAVRLELGIAMGRAIGEMELSTILRDMRSDRHLKDGIDRFSKDPTIVLTPAGRKAAPRL